MYQEGRSPKMESTNLTSDDKADRNGKKKKIPRRKETESNLTGSSVARWPAHGDFLNYSTASLPRRGFRRCARRQAWDRDAFIWWNPNFLFTLNPSLHFISFHFLIHLASFFCRAARWRPPFPPPERRTGESVHAQTESWRPSLLFFFSFWLGQSNGFQPWGNRSKLECSFVYRLTAKWSLRLRRFRMVTVQRIFLG